MSAAATRLYLSRGNSANNYFIDVYEVTPDPLSNKNPVLISAWGPIESPITKMTLSKDERFLVASTLRTTYFLSTANNKLSLLGEPFKISGTLYVTEHVHGPDDSFIILGTPFFENYENYGYGWPLEAIAVDKPELGELWRFNYGGDGTVPSRAIAVAFDDDGRVWMRMGAKLAKLLPKEYYRKVITPK